MALGFLLLDGTTRAQPDKNLSKNTKPRVRTSIFGDGYVQRLSAGLNPLEQTFSISFNGRAKAEIDDISTFLDTKKGVSSFDFTYPDTNGGSNETTVKVICSDYSTNYSHDEFYNLTATFNRVYEV